MPRITVCQPDPRVPLDRFDGWLREAGARLSVVRLWEQPVPTLDAVGDGLLLLGGRMSAHDHRDHPWLDPLADLLADATEVGVPVLGICLGHQVLAEALGGEVKVAHAAGGEDGPVQLEWLGPAASDPLLADAVAAGRVQPASHHDAVTRLPEGAVELARTALYPNQAFRVGASVGVQFHPEASPALLGAWEAGDGRDPAPVEAAMRAVDAEVERVGRAIATAFVRLCG